MCHSAGIINEDDASLSTPSLHWCHVTTDGTAGIRSLQIIRGSVETALRTQTCQLKLDTEGYRWAVCFGPVLKASSATC